MPPEWKSRLVFWLRLFVVIVVSAYVAAIIFSAASMLATFTTPLKGSICCQSPRDFGAEYEDITFRTANGLTLSGWYIASKNGAVIVLVHSYRVDRRQTLPVAKILARHGYGILMYDQRATGKSEGDMRSFGWLDVGDVSQAVAFAQSQPGIYKNRIGLYGCSVGGGIVVTAAAGNPSVAAVAADAVTSLTFEGARSGNGASDWFINLPIFALYFSAVSLRSGTLPPLSTIAAVQGIAPRPLLLLSAGAERSGIEALYARAGEPKEQHNIPGAVHCHGPLSHPAEYEQYLVSFFDTALLKNQPRP